MAPADHEPNTLFHAARTRKGLSRQQLADAVNKHLPPRALITAGEIGRIERGSVAWPRAPRRAALRAVLGASSDAEIGLTNKRRRPTDTLEKRSAVHNGERSRRDQPPTDVHHCAGVYLAHDSSVPASRAAADERAATTRHFGDWTEAHGMLRRTVLITLATAAGNAFLGSGHGELPASGSNKTFMTAGVDHWQETVAEYGYAYLVTPRAKLLADLRDDLGLIKQELSAHLKADSAAARPIAAATAQLVALSAMICTDLGFAREGQHLWRFARRYAAISEDQAVRLWINGHEITSGIYQQRPLPLLNDLANNALAMSSRASPTAGKAELLGGQAQVLSLQGRTGEAQTALNELRDTYEQLPATITELRDSFFGWPEHRLRHAESFVCSMTGTTADAYRAQDLALKLYPASWQISRCQIQLHRARCLIRDGGLDDGLHRAGAAIEKIEVPKRKEFVLSIADRVAEAAPPDRRSQAKAAEFRDFVRAARIGARP